MTPPLPTELSLHSASREPRRNCSCHARCAKHQGRSQNHDCRKLRLVRSHHGQSGHHGRNNRDGENRPSHRTQTKPQTGRTPTRPRIHRAPTRTTAWVPPSLDPSRSNSWGPNPNRCRSNQERRRNRGCKRVRGCRRVPQERHIRAVPPDHSRGPELLPSPAAPAAV